MLKLLILPIALLGCLISLSSCCKDPIVVPPQNIYCPAPQRPVLTEMNIDKQYSDIDNIKTLLNVINDVIGYSLKMEETINCYEKSQPDKKNKVQDNRILNEIK